MACWCLCGPPPVLSLAFHICVARHRSQTWLAGACAACHLCATQVRHLWNSMRALVNAAPLLLEPTPALLWALGDMPPSPQPPEPLMVAPKEAKGAKGGPKKEEATKVCLGGACSVSRCWPTFER